MGKKNGCVFGWSVLPKINFEIVRIDLWVQNGNTCQLFQFFCLRREFWNKNLFYSVRIFMNMLKTFRVKYNYFNLRITLE